MKFRRVLSLILAVLTVAACAAVIGTAAASGADIDAVETGASAYQDMKAKTTAENKYGLADTVNEGTILQAWNWSFKNIEANLEKIAEQGFTTIQVSPPNVLKADTKGVKVYDAAANKNGWWMFYQPAGFQLNTASDNNSALGTKDEFISMCSKAHELGLKVIVDAVINHMGTKDNDDKNTSSDPMTHVTPLAQKYEPEIYNGKLFHTPWAQMTYKEDPYQFSQYESTYDLTRNCTSGLPDLKTEDATVQKVIYDYMAELIESGADGFRFDAAKHIETPDDISGLRSSFWTNTLQKVRKAYPNNEVYAYGEILNTCGVNRPYSMYTKLFDVTDSGSYWDISNAVRGYGGNATPYYPNSNFTKANTILWDESHDTYMDNSTTALTVAQRNKIWALVAGRAEITTVYFARPSDDTGWTKVNDNIKYPTATKNITLGDLKMTAWSNNVTKAINQFHNYFVKEAEYCTANSGGAAYIERGASGCMVVALSGTTTKTISNVTVHTLQNGTYTDSITGTQFTVKNKKLSGKIGNTGVACLYYDEGATTPTTTPKPTSENPTTAPKPTDSPVNPTTPDNYDPTREGCYTVIFSNSIPWSGTINIYYWSESNGEAEAWPGKAMPFYQQNEYGQNQYIAFIPMEYEKFIINNGSSQTIDIPISDHTGVYCTSANGEGKYDVDFWELNPYIPEDPTDAPEPTEPATEAPLPTDAPVPTQAPPQPTSSMTSYIVGDANLNGKLEITDATAIQRHLAEIEIFGADARIAGDTDEDGRVVIVDATIIQRFLADMGTTSRCGQRVTK